MNYEKDFEKKCTILSAVYEHIGNDPRFKDLLERKGHWLAWGQLNDYSRVTREGKEIVLNDYHYMLVSFGLSHRDRFNTFDEMMNIAIRKWGRNKVTRQ